MKNKISVIILLLLIANIACKEQPKNQEIEQVEEAKPFSKSDVEIAVANFNKALVNPTVELMENLCADELTYGHSSGLIQNKSEFIDDIVNGAFDFTSVEAPNQTIHLDGNTAIVRHIFLAKATNKGVPVDIRIGNMQVYQRNNDGSWKLLARQAFKLPPAN